MPSSPWCRWRKADPVELRSPHHACAPRSRRRAPARQGRGGALCRGHGAGGDRRHRATAGGAGTRCAAAHRGAGRRTGDDLRDRRGRLGLGPVQSDGYVGWLPAAALLAPKGQPTHKVAALRTLVFPGPSIKLPPTEALPLGARLAVVRSEDTFAVTAAGGYLPRRHLAPLDCSEIDFVALAERFVGIPYLWGGKSSLGIDCSGLVQVTLIGLRHRLPARQRHAGGGAWQAHRPCRPAARRPDVLEGPCRDRAQPHLLIHANAFHMAVAIEPLANAIDAYPRGWQRGDQRAAAEMIGSALSRSARCSAGAARARTTIRRSRSA